MRRVIQYGCDATWKIPIDPIQYKEKYSGFLRISLLVIRIDDDFHFSCVSTTILLGARRNVNQL